MSAPRFQQDVVDPAADPAPDPGAGPADSWYLSFDCATKSFAYCLLRIRPLSADAGDRLRLAEAALENNDLGESRRLLAALDAETRTCLHLAAGGAADLVPGKKDKSIPTVARIRALVRYLGAEVAAALAAAAADGCPPPDSPRLNVAVEFQMGANAPARTVADVLLTTYSRANVFLVGPGYKNKLWYASRPDLRHCYFVEKYGRLYSANKAHAAALYFDHVSPTFGHDSGPVVEKIPRKFRKDFSDCVLQVLGFLQFGDVDNAADKF